MSYNPGPSIHPRSISDIYHGRLHYYSPLHEIPRNPYAQYSGILGFLRRELERSAEQRHLKSEAEIEKDEAEVKKRKKYEIEQEEDLEIG